MADISTADLFSVQNTIINIVRSEVKGLRDEFHREIQDVKTAQQQHADRADVHTEKLAKLEERTRAAGRSLLANLTPKQKAAIVATAVPIAGSILADLWRLIGTVASMFLKGVHP